MTKQNIDTMMSITLTLKHAHRILDNCNETLVPLATKFLHEASEQINSLIEATNGDQRREVAKMAAHTESISSKAAAFYVDASISILDLPIGAMDDATFNEAVAAKKALQNA